MSSFYLFIFLYMILCERSPESSQTANVCLIVKKQQYGDVVPAEGKNKKNKQIQNKYIKKKVLKLMEKNIDYNMHLKWGD